MGNIHRSRASGNMAMMWYFSVLGLFYIKNALAIEVQQQASACERKNLDISCEAGKLLHIDWANYGRLDTRTNCGTQGIQGVKNCRASNSLDIVKNRCQSKRSCSIHAGNSVFGDPCRGTVKYLEVHYQCITSEAVQQQASACERQNLDISCKAGKILRIDWANYGRLDKRTNCGTYGIEGVTNCRAFLSLEIVKFRCQSKRPCSIHAGNSVFGDPCRGTVKYLEVHYQCIPSEGFAVLIGGHTGVMDVWTPELTPNPRTFDALPV